MKVCVFGAGAIGSHVAARLASGGHAEVSVVARGAQLTAIRERGLVLKSGGREIHAMPSAVEGDASALPPQDLVISTVKAHALPPLAGTLEQLLAPAGSVLFPLNGITWWWHHGLSGAAGGPLPLLDPAGELWQRLASRALGCVVHSPNELAAPGVVVHAGGNRWLIAEPSGDSTHRVRAVAELFRRSGFDAEVPTDLRAEVWRKLVRNASGNTLAALTRLNLFEIAAREELAALSIGLARETLEVAAALGWDLRGEIDLQALARRGERDGPRPSMLQDVLLGRRLEVEAILGQTHAFAREAGVAVPTMDVILPLLRALDRSLATATQPRG
jgi:2-dehydropantoate 2-reductase